ncbi:hypothetical protein PanWU01x14_192790 [Parasponia andersonii]|uniref:Uncharacterized protein n=1 Tax=Parasponia andersonii TaxID=3476 RepID=A0A2P5C131_PARAD|nr:hypothetical protein PanWU01x14_192790 [Parasponia andersonii]
MDRRKSTKSYHSQPTIQSFPWQRALESMSSFQSSTIGLVNKSDFRNCAEVPQKFYGNERI